MFKVGDKVVRHPMRRNMNWPHAGRAVEVIAVKENGDVQIAGDARTTWWTHSYFVLYVEPAAQEADPSNPGWCKGCNPDNCEGCGNGLAKFDGKPEPTPAETVKLKGDLLKVLEHLKRQPCPMSLRMIAIGTGVSELSVGSRVRDLRKSKFGAP